MALGNVLPPFTADGVLPPGDHPLTLDELKGSMLVVGPSPAIPTWDNQRRLRQVKNLAQLVEQLRDVGIVEIYIDGSFVQNKPSPGDIDGYYVVDPLVYPRDQHTKLEQINPLLTDVAKKATWEYVKEKGESRPRMWRVYQVELFRVVRSPLMMRPGQLPHFFRYTRDGIPKGIIRLID